MSQFKQIVKNIALESEKCGYNPKKNTNWADLDWDMRDEYLKHMDFKTRIRLSQTCRFEKFMFDEEFRNFGYVAKTIASESEKSNYNPEIGTNWDCLPLEMRNECVKWMSYRTRTRLGATSKTEKLLVEAKKYNIDQVRLYCDIPSGEWAFKMNSETFTCSGPGVTDAFLSAMFKNSEIKHVWIKEEEFDRRNYTDYAQIKLAKFAPFHFKRVSVFCDEDFAFFVENCVNLEKVDYCGEFTPDEKILELPSVLNVKEFRISEAMWYPFVKFLPGLVQKWIDNNVEIGKSMQFIAVTPGMVGIFAKEFSSRVVEETDKEVRIRMNNEKTQILLRIIGAKRNSIRFFGALKYEYCSCKVIPIDLPKSEYAVGDGWIQAVYEKRLKDDGILVNPVEFDAEDQAVWENQYF